MKAYFFRIGAMCILIASLCVEAASFHVAPQVVLNEKMAVPNGLNDFLLVYKEYGDFLLHVKKWSDERMQYWLSHLDDPYLVNKAENDWIKELYRRHDFSKIRVFSKNVQSLDKVSQCIVWQSFAEDHKKSVWSAVFDHYLDASWPQECSVLMDSLTRSHFLTDNDRWARAHRLWDSERYAFFIEHMHVFENSHFPIASIQRMIVDPLSFVRMFLHKKHISDGEQEAIIMSLTSCVYKQFDDAFRLWKAISSKLHLNAQQENYVYAHFAYAAARLHNPLAISLYQKVDFQHLDPVYLAWYLRAAIRQKKWALLSFLIENLPIHLRQKPIWVYWLAYSKEQQGQTVVSDRLYASIAMELNYYGVLASEAIGRTVIFPASLTIQEADIQRVLHHKGILRGIALFKQGNWLDAVGEWNWANKSMSPADQLASSRIAYAYGMYDRAIHSLEGLHKKACFVMSFPMPYQDAVHMAVESSGLPGSWLLGLMRQESRFISQAHSSAGALGLMQLMPHTARHTAHLMGHHLNFHHILEPDTNVTLGAYYFRQIYDNLDKNIVLAIAAYNAGPVRVTSWCVPDSVMDAQIFVETIPFIETRKYVKKVLFNIFVYSRLFEHKMTSLHSFLGMISPNFSKKNQKIVQSLE